jgi:hypothetical protein
MNSLYVQDNIHPDLNEFPWLKVCLYAQGIHLDLGESCLVRTGNSFRSGLVVLYVQGIHLVPGESCLVRTGNSFRQIDMNSLCVQANFQPDLNEFPVCTRQLLPRSK